MSRLSLILGIVVLAVAVLIAQATFAGQTSAGQPGAGATPTAQAPDSLSDGASPDRGVPDSLAGLANLQNSADDLDPDELEVFRQDLLDLVDTLEALYPYAEAYGRATGEAPPELVSKDLIRSLTYDQLRRVRGTFGDAYEPFSEDVERLKTLVVNPDADKLVDSERDVFQVAPEAVTANAVASNPPTSIDLIPAPTPVTSPPPGINHQGIDEADRVNDVLGDLPAPNYPTSVGCPETRFPNPATLTTLILTAIAKEVDDFADEAGCEGTFFVVAVPFGGGTNLPGCLGWAVLKGITLAISAVDEGLNFCIGRIDAAELEASRQNVRILHAELAMHDENLTQRLNENDNFLFHFRNLNLRSRMEANLASEEDDPVAFYALPNSICIEGISNLSAAEENDPSVKYSAERLANCGLLEVVSDTVRSAIDMTAGANVSVNNAESEFQAAVDHYNNQRWKLAYDRFRKAYREVLKP